MTEYKLIYIAGPYTHADAEVREWRRKWHGEAAAWYCKAYPTAAIFSPVLFGCAFEPFLLGENCSHEFWMRHCLPMLQAASHMALLPLSGMLESRGTREEIRFAAANNIPIISTWSVPVSALYYPESANESV